VDGCAINSCPRIKRFRQKYGEIESKKIFLKARIVEKIHSGPDDFSSSGSLSISSGPFIPWYIHHPMIRIIGIPTGIANPAKKRHRADKPRNIPPQIVK
jgi:hypothetical protein